MSAPTHIKLIALLITILAVQYLIVIAWGTFGNGLIIYQTEDIGYSSLEKHVLINRLIYWGLSFGLLGASVLMLKRPIWASILLLCSMPFVINDDSGTAFDLTANLMGIGSGSTQTFDFLFNEIKLAMWLWYLSVGLVSVAFLCSVAAFLKQRRVAQDSL